MITLTIVCGVFVIAYGKNGSDMFYLGQIQRALLDRSHHSLHRCVAPLTPDIS